MGGIEGSECGIVAVGVSTGGMEALPRLLSHLPATFSMPLVVIQHIAPDAEQAFMIEFLNERIALDVTEARERERVQAGRVYLAPANYHLLVERERTFALSVDEKVNYSRPSIDVLFESVAEAFGGTAVGVVLTGASDDGARGLKRIGERGGRTLVQAPETAESAIMPLAAMKACPGALTASLDGIASRLIREAGLEAGTEGTAADHRRPQHSKRKREELAE